MKTSSAKAKGRRAAQAAKDSLIKASIIFPGSNGPLHSDDIVVTGSGDTGEDLKLSPRARERYPFNFEVKNQEKLNIWAALKQSQDHGQYYPIVVFTRNHEDLYCSLKFNDFLKLLNGVK